MSYRHDLIECSWSPAQIVVGAKDRKRGGVRGRKKRGLKSDRDRCRDKKRTGRKLELKIKKGENERNILVIILAD